MKKIVTCLFLFIVSLPCYCQKLAFAPHARYHALAPYNIVARFPAPPQTSAKQDYGPIVSTVFHTTVYDDPNFTYSIAIANHKTINRISDSLNELKSVVDYFNGKMTEINSIKISSAKSIFQNKTCYYSTYKARWVDEDINDSLVSSDLYFFLDSFVVRAHVSTLVKNYPNASIAEFFKSINLNAWPDNDGGEIFLSLPVMPLFGKQPDDFREYIKKVSKYPIALAKSPDTPKPMYVKILIEKDGKVQIAEILKGINKEYDTEVLSIVRNMPEWSPGKLSNGDPARVSMTFPLWFP